MKKSIIILVAVFVVACSECDPGAFHCQGQDLEVCDGDGRWEFTMACDEVESFDGTAWACCDGDAGPGCYWEEECEDGATP